jgi:hypothetical protein
MAGEKMNLRALLATILNVTLIMTMPIAVMAGEHIVISGTITSITGEPVAGAEVYLYAAENTRKPADYISPKSGQDGVYRITAPKARYKAIARIKKGERYGPLMPGDRHSGEPVNIIPDEENELTLDFTVADMQELAQRREKELEELAQISGKVSSPGKRIQSVYVYARKEAISASLPEYFSGWAGTDGRYSLKLPPGRYFLGVATEFPPVDTTAELKEVTISLGKLPVAIDLQLPLQ